jgi:4-amino-4-deoxy-L-arabinose transferase-like glycosyltransferase/putative flippase GtrA
MSATFAQLLRFGLVGALNTSVDLLALNLIVWTLHIQTVPPLMAANALAYGIGAVQSFVLNKRLTFRRRTRVTPGEMGRFALTTLAGITLNDALLWIVGCALLPFAGPTQFWANLTKGIAIGGTVLISYFGMRLWVFARRPHLEHPARTTTASALVSPPSAQFLLARQREQRRVLSSVLARHGISVVLPAYNEEAAIGATVAAVVSVLDEWHADFEVIVVDDGSRDRTAAVVAALAQRDARVCQIAHRINRGYGAALATGFAAATKDLTFFMDADGQFTIRDLAWLLPFVDQVDAVLGYRLQRQDSWLRRLNAWGWSLLVAVALGLRVRDLDCAFKLLRTEFLHAYPPETPGALVNAELLFKLAHTGGTYRQVGVSHRPRQRGRATGAKPRVIVRVLWDLATHAHRWRRTWPRASHGGAGNSALAHGGQYTTSSQFSTKGPRMRHDDFPAQQTGFPADQEAFLVIPEQYAPGTQPEAAIEAPSREGPRAPSQALRLLAPHRLALVAILLLSIALNFWMLGQNGYGNLYYAAAVKSMASNWHAFFFASLDPAGFVSVDKPPLGFWLQAASVRLVGFTPFALFLPQALAGVLSVLLLFWLVRRHFGVVAGVIAALALAVSPISVVTNRNNTIDSTLLLALLLGAWATFRAIETDKLRWLLLAGVCVALGFNIKMLEAYLVVPAFLLAYLLGSRRPWARGLSTLALSGAVMVGLSLAWVVAVDAIPAALRPWVGSTQNNSALSLALGYNGVQRLTGAGGPGGGSAPAGGPGGPGSGPAGGFPGGPPPGALGGVVGAGVGDGAATAYGPPGLNGNQGGPGGAGGQVGMFNTGNPGLLRLFTPPLAGQIVWLLPLSLIGLLALALARPFRPREDRQQQSLILWGTWLVTMAIFFSVATFFHQYYLSQMAPAIAAMSGIGIVVMWRHYLQPGWRGWFLPLALGATALEQISLITNDPSWGTWLLPVLAVTAVVALVLAGIRLLPYLNFRRSLGVAAVSLVLLGLLAAPTVWSAYPALANTAPDLPEAGLASGMGSGNSYDQVNAQLVAYLGANQGAATYLVAVPSSQESAPIIIATGKAVMTLGGFNGSDSILTTSQLQALIQAGTVRYFLLSGRGDGPAGPAGPGGSGTSQITQWVTSNCSVVDASAYGGSTSASGSAGAQGSPGGGAGQLYDCSIQGSKG